MASRSSPPRPRPTPLPTRPSGLVPLPPASPPRPQRALALVCFALACVGLAVRGAAGWILALTLLPLGLRYWTGRTDA